MRLLLVGVLVLALAGCGSDRVREADRPVHSAAGLVQAYCRYGAVSRAQLQGCIEHVTPEAVLAHKTNAARYAEGDLRGCLGDAGPFCR
jgi:hypothetical protein